MMLTIILWDVISLLLSLYVLFDLFIIPIIVSILNFLTNNSYHILTYNETF